MRTGISVDGITELQRFEPSVADDDPALLWFIDIRCEGAQIPTDPEEARRWLLANSAWLSAGLDDTAEHLAVGVDSDVLPFQRTIRQSPKGIKAQVVGSAIRRIDAREISKHIRAIRRNWKRLVGGLEPVNV